MNSASIKKVLDDMVFIVDTREQKNKHIIAYFKRFDIPYVIKKLDSGDYSFELPNYNFLGLDESVLVERKNSWSEITQNFTKGRERFTREFERIGDKDIHILIENATWSNLMLGQYHSQMQPKSLLANILTCNTRYNAPVWLATTNESPTLLCNILRYGLREKLKNKD